MRRAADRQVLREEMTRLWTGLLDAQQGDCLVRPEGGRGGGGCSPLCVEYHGAASAVWAIIMFQALCIL